MTAGAEGNLDGLDRLRADNVAAWSRDTSLGDWPVVANTSSASYIAALEAEVDRLRALAGERPLRCPS